MKEDKNGVNRLTSVDVLLPASINIKMLTLPESPAYLRQLLYSKLYI
jgi:hypothetical protein